MGGGGLFATKERILSRRDVSVKISLPSPTITIGACVRNCLNNYDRTNNSYIHLFQASGINILYANTGESVEWIVCVCPCRLNDTGRIDNAELIIRANYERHYTV